MPSSIELDGQEIDWGEDDRALIPEDGVVAWLAGPTPRGIHRNAEGAGRGSWVKRG